MKIDEKGELLADWEAITRLSKCFDKGCKSEEAYRAKLFSLVLEHGYDAAMDDMSRQHAQLMYMMCAPAGHA